MNRLIATAFVATVLAGCATSPPKVWSKDGATEEQFRRDKITCHQVGLQSAQANGLSGNMFVGIWIRDEGEKCLRALGYEAD